MTTSRRRFLKACMTFAGAYTVPVFVNQVSPLANFLSNRDKRIVPTDIKSAIMANDQWRAAIPRLLMEGVHKLFSQDYKNNSTKWDKMFANG